MYLPINSRELKHHPAHSAVDTSHTRFESLDRSVQFISIYRSLVPDRLPLSPRRNNRLRKPPGDSSGHAARARYMQFRRDPRASSRNYSYWATLSRGTIDRARGVRCQRYFLVYLDFRLRTDRTRNHSQTSRAERSVNAAID